MYQQPGPFKPLWKQTFEQLITGLDYGRYRNQRAARMDDQLVRQRAAGLIQDAQEAITRKHTEWKELFIPQTIEPGKFPDSVTMTINRHTDTVIKNLGSLRALFHTMPVPEASDFWDRYVSQEQRVAALRAQDERLLQAAYELKMTAPSYEIGGDGEAHDNTAFRKAYTELRYCFDERMRLLR
jgi:hypothetical protein